ncbi:MAG: molybdopterin oxidoreductase, partial [Krumholzibacteria bacterium]|nr:molybdopterin oxidoreductase [Candidatus Krumholzibacteria bacterium]
MDLNRRCFLQIFGGAAAGVAFSPLPWKLLDDAAIWTQNWSWIARPPRGPVSHTFTTCTLCPTGCGLRLRRIGPHPVAGHAQRGHRVGPDAAQAQAAAGRTEGAGGEGVADRSPRRPRDPGPVL